MSPQVLSRSPSPHFRSPDGHLIACELHIAAVREQAAIVRAFLDEVERLVPRSAAQEAAGRQVIEELAGLGHRILEAAAVMAKAVDGQPTYSAAAI